MKDPNGSIDQCSLDDRGPLDPEEFPFNDMVKLLRAERAPRDYEHCRCKCHSIHDADYCLVRHFLGLHFRDGENECSKNRECQGIEIESSCILADLVTQQDTDNSPQCRNLCEGQVDKDHFARDEVYSQIHVDTRQDEACGE